VCASAFTYLVHAYFLMLRFIKSVVRQGRAPMELVTRRRARSGTHLDTLRIVARILSQAYRMAVQWFSRQHGIWIHTDITVCSSGRAWTIARVRRNVG
jgi:hypothetical protein